MYIEIKGNLINLDVVQSIGISGDDSKPAIAIDFPDHFLEIPADDKEEAEELYGDIWLAMRNLGRLYDPDVYEIKEETRSCPLEADEEAELQDLLDKGFRWIARDKDGKAYAYCGKPELFGACWEDTVPLTPLGVQPPPARLRGGRYSFLMYEGPAENIAALLLDS